MVSFALARAPVRTWPLVTERAGRSLSVGRLLGERGLPTLSSECSDDWCGHTPQRSGLWDAWRSWPGAPRHSLIEPTTSDQAGLPAELKHISKRRKRN